MARVCKCGRVLGANNNTGLCTGCYVRTHCVLCGKSAPGQKGKCSACTVALREVQRMRVELGLDREYSRPPEAVRERLIEEHRRRVEHEERRCRGK